MILCVAMEFMHCDKYWGIWKSRNPEMETELEPEPEPKK